MSLNAGGGGGCGVSANENSCAHHVTWSPNKLWRSNSIFKLCEHRNDLECFNTTARAVPAVDGVPAVPNIPVVAGNPAFAVAKSQQQQRANKSTDANFSRNASKSRDARHVRKTSCRRAVNSRRVRSKVTLAPIELQGWQQE
jgi:hypothetical protein